MVVVVAAKKSWYEEMREKRIEENRKRMEQLNKLGQFLQPPKRKFTRVPKLPLDPSSIRRSNRVADKPPEVPYGLSMLPRSRRYKRRDLSNRMYASDEDRAYAIQRSKDLQSSLDQNIPSFVKPIFHSNVNGGCLALPHRLKMHLPSCSEFIRLIDEKEEETLIKYLILKPRLSAGWPGFANAHELVDGDALVFQIVEPTTFKVYIIRVDKLGKSDS